MCSESNNIRQIRSIKKSWFYRLCATFFEKLYELCHCRPSVLGNTAATIFTTVQRYYTGITSFRSFTKGKCLTMSHSDYHHKIKQLQ